MKYQVDIERKLYAIKTFDVEADNEDEATEKALELALNMIWSNYDKSQVTPMSVTRKG